MNVLMSDEKKSESKQPSEEYVQIEAAMRSEQTVEGNTSVDRSQIEQGARRNFRPFIWVHTEDGAHFFLTALGERQVKVLWFSEGFECLPTEDQLAKVKGRVQEHYQSTGGKYVGFGVILRYQFADSFDTSMVLDTAGNIIEKTGQFLLPEVYMELK